MRGLQTDRTAQVVIAGHVFMQNLRRGRYELAVDTRPDCASPRRSTSSPRPSDSQRDRAPRRSRLNNATVPSTLP
jgi:hypothetical protein